MNRSVKQVLSISMALLCTAACTTAPLADTTMVDGTVEQANAAYTNENWPETASLYAELTKQTPANARYWYRLAVAQRYLGDHTAALASLDQGVENGLPTFYADYERAKVAATLGNNSQAIALLESAAAAGLSGKERVLENPQLAALENTDGFDDVLDRLDANAFPCRDKAFHEFDFWLGDWEVRTANGAMAGRNSISARESDCLLLEEWTSATGGSGTSMNYYDAEVGKWTQVWISPGLQLRITGGMQNGSMVLTGKAHYIQQGTTSPFRGTWTPLEDGRVRQFFEQQDSEGNWTPWFEGFYTRIEAEADGD